MTNPADQHNPSTNLPFRDRRSRDETAGPPGVERRQFANSHQDLSPPARELAIAVDEYKIRHHRRFITFEEVLSIVRSLGYAKTNTSTTRS